MKATNTQVRFFKRLDPIIRRAPYGLSVTGEATRWFCRKKDGLYEAKRAAKENNVELINEVEA